MAKTTYTAFRKSDGTYASTTDDNFKKFFANDCTAIESGLTTRQAHKIVVNLTAENKSRRQVRYGNLIRGWDWRTTEELLDKAEKTRLEMKLSKTEFLERAIKELIERA